MFYVLVPWVTFHHPLSVDQSSVHSGTWMRHKYVKKTAFRGRIQTVAKNKMETRDLVKDRLGNPASVYETFD